MIAIAVQVCSGNAHINRLAQWVQRLLLRLGAALIAFYISFLRLFTLSVLGYRLLQKIIPKIKFRAP